MLNINVLGASMVLGIVRNCYASLVVCKHYDGKELLVLAIQTLTEEDKAKPNCFLSSLCECHILSFSGLQGHSGLFLGRPGDWRLTSQKNSYSGVIEQI